MNSLNWEALEIKFAAALELDAWTIRNCDAHKSRI
jgi:hypothetical protein